MNPLRTCRECYGGGYYLMSSPDSVDLVPCEACRGKGLVVCDHTHKERSTAIPSPFTTIALANGKDVLIDAEDESIVEGYAWYENPGRHTTYAATRTGPRDNRKSLIMHRLIMNAPKGMVVDHINGNGLDNRKANLRLCTSRENVTRSRMRSDTTSRYRGVSLCKQTGRWDARIQSNSMRIWIGRFDTAEEAALAYNEAAKKFHGEFAVLNELCPRCNDTGWMPEMDMEGHYTCDIPCTCATGHRLMRAVSQTAETFRNDAPF